VISLSVMLKTALTSISMCKSKNLLEVLSEDTETLKRKLHDGARRNKYHSLSLVENPQRSFHNDDDELTD